MDQIPSAPGGLPLLGHTVPLLRDPLGFLSSLYGHGDVLRIRLGAATVVMICDPGMTQQMLRDDRTFDKGGPLFQRMREVMGNGLATCPHAQHRRQRRLVQPAFHPGRLPGYADVMSDQAVTVAESWRAGQVVDVTAEMMTITSGALAATVFAGTDLSKPGSPGSASSDSALPGSALPGSALPGSGRPGPSPAGALPGALDDLTTLLGGLYRRIMMPPPLDRLPTPGNRRYHQARARLRDTLGAAIAQHRTSSQHRASTHLDASTDDGDLLSALLAARNPDGDGLTDEEIADQAVTFFIAGTETTAALLAWALYLLAQHPDVERQVHAEASAAMAAGIAAHARLSRLAVTRRVVMETLRLYGPAWVITRAAAREVQLGGYTLPAAPPSSTVPTCCTAGPTCTRPRPLRPRPLASRPHGQSCGHDRYGHHCRHGHHCRRHCPGHRPGRLPPLRRRCPQMHRGHLRHGRGDPRPRRHRRPLAPEARFQPRPPQRRDHPAPPQPSHASHPASGLTPRGQSLASS